MKTDTHPYTIVVNVSQLRIHTELSLPVLEQLTQTEQWSTFQEELRQYASRTETVHRLGDFPFSLPISFLPFSPTSSTLPLSILLPRFLFLSRRFRLLLCSVEPLRGDITRSSPTCIKEERIICWVIQGQVCGFVGREVGEVEPVPGCDEDIGGLEVAMGDFAITRVSKCGK